MVQRLCRLCFSITFFLFLIAFLFYIGFSNSEENSRMLRSMFRILFFILFFSKFLPEIMQIRRKTVISIILGIIVFLFSFGVFLSNFHIVNNNKSLWAFIQWKYSDRYSNFSYWHFRNIQSCQVYKFNKDSSCLTFLLKFFYYHSYWFRTVNDAKGTYSSIIFS